MFQFIKENLTKIDFEDKTTTMNMANKKLSLKIKLDEEFKSEKLEKEYHAHKMGCTFEYMYTTEDEPENEKMAAKITVEYTSLYNYTEDENNKNTDEYEFINNVTIPSIVFPSLRNHIYSVLAHTSLPKPNIPIINFIARYKNTQEKAK